MKSNKKKHLVCKVDELRAANSLGSEIVIYNALIQCFLVYHQNKVLSYLNRCPHTGVNLDWVPNQFLDSKHEFIQCATHGALFKIESGLCVHGPCLGDKLKKVENVIIDNKIYLIL